MTLPLVVLVGDHPMPAPGADTVEVYEQIGEATTFRVRSGVPWVDGDFPTLRDDRYGPEALFSIGTASKDTQHVLCHGPLHAHQIHYRHGGTAMVDFVGSDETLAMDREQTPKVWPDGKVSDTVYAILQARGFTPAVDPVEVQNTAAGHSLVQYDSDLRFVRRLARRYGCWFWLRRDPAGKTIASFKRPPAPAPKIPTTIRINRERPSVDELDLEWDVACPTAAVANQLGLRDKKAIDGHVDKSPAPLLAAKALVDVAKPWKVRVAAPVDSLSDLQARAGSALVDAGWFVCARGTTTARRLGAVLRTHEHVTLEGAGSRHDGTYVVSRVKHVTDTEEHRMEFELVRNAWGA